MKIEIKKEWMIVRDYETCGIPVAFGRYFIPKFFRYLKLQHWWNKNCKWATKNPCRGNYIPRGKLVGLLQ